MIVPRLLAVLAPLAGVATAAYYNPLLETRQASGGSPTPPRQDPFYTPTGDWQSAKPGDILASRDVPHPLKNVNYTSAHQILYRSTDSLGNASYGLTTVIVPNNANFSRLLSYQIYYDTPDVDCSPSYTLQVGGLFSLDQGFSDLLSMGAVVNTPDYEGPFGQFVAGVQSGQSTLDSIRAVLQSKDVTGVESSAQIAMWGYSGGALASEWAAELQPAYAPELQISAAALGGLTPNVTSVALSVNNKTLAGLIPAGIIGLSKAYPNITNLLNSSFTSDANREAFYGVTSDCIAEIAVQYADTDYLGFFKGGGEALLFDPRTQSVTNAGGQMGLHGTPSIPLYVYKSTLDEVSPVRDTDQLIAKYCGNGARIQYIRDDFGSHTGEGTAGVPGAMNFLNGVFNGTATFPDGCTIKTIKQGGSVESSSSVTATMTLTSSSSAPSGTSSGAAGGTTSSGTPSGTDGTNPSETSSGGMPGSTTGAAARGEVGVNLAGLGLFGGLLLL